MHLPLITTERIFPFSLLALTIASSLPAYGGKFNPKFLENVQGIDQHIRNLPVYDSPVGQQTPGKYRVSVFVNEEEEVASRTLDFSTASEAKRKASGESLMPCLSRVQLEEMGVRVDSFPALKMSPPEACVAFDEIIPQEGDQPL
ncbi:FimD/PapC N-terminal domain-containing protein [Escherichia coli]